MDLQHVFDDGCVLQGSFDHPSIVDDRELIVREVKSRAPAGVVLADFGGDGSRVRTGLGFPIGPRRFIAVHLYTDLG
jgi:hypothetical protein